MASLSGRSRWLDYDVATPGLVLDLDIVDSNLDEMAKLARANGVSLIPHAKTHRIDRLGVRQIERGADGLTVAKLGEAEGFERAGVSEIFVANPIAGNDKFVRAWNLSRRCRLTLATDTLTGARALGAHFAAHGDSVRVMLAVDTGLGREGVRPEDASALAVEVAALPGVDLVGIYTHEGSVYQAANTDELRRFAQEAAQKMVTVAGRIRARGVDLPIVSMGASASARLCAVEPGVTQIRPGIYAFNDAGQIALGNADLETSAVRVIATVTSHPEVGRACIDAGSKALSADLLPASSLRSEYPGYGIIVNAPGWIIDRVSEEHGWLRWRGAGESTPLPVGTRLEIVPNHVCMAFAMLRRAHIVRGGVLKGTWDTFGPGYSE